MVRSKSCLSVLCKFLAFTEELGVASIYFCPLVEFLSGFECLIAHVIKDFGSQNRMGALIIK
jgi:hypothetical protein